MARRAPTVEKITVSLPPELVRYAERRAAEMGRNRSQIIAEAIADLRAQEADELAREGYAFYASESEEFAAASAKAASEALERGR